MQQAKQKHRGRTLRGLHLSPSTVGQLRVRVFAKVNTAFQHAAVVKKVPFALGFAKAAAMQAGPRRDDTGEAPPLHLNDGEPTATLRVSTTESSMSEEVTAAPTPEYANTVSGQQRFGSSYGSSHGRIRPLEMLDTAVELHHNTTLPATADSLPRPSPRRGPFASPLQQRTESTSDALAAQPAAQAVTNDPAQYEELVRTAICQALSRALPCSAAQRTLGPAVPLRPPPSLPSCYFPAEERLEGAQVAGQLLAKLEAAVNDGADECEKELLSLVADHLTCVSAALRQVPATALSQELDQGISRTVSCVLLPTIREFAEREKRAAAAPSFDMMAERLTRLHAAEAACERETDVRGRKEALKRVCYICYI